MLQLFFSDTIREFKEKTIKNNCLNYVDYRENCTLKPWGSNLWNTCLDLVFSQHYLLHTLCQPRKEEKEMMLALVLEELKIYKWLETMNLKAMCYGF